MTRHRDGDRVVRGVDGALLQALAFGSHDERNPRILGHTFGQSRELIQRQRTLAQRQSRRGNPRAMQALDGSRPLVDPGPRHLKHRPHRDSHRAPVERIATIVTHQHRIHPQRRRGTEDRPDVDVVSDYDRLQGNRA